MKTILMRSFFRSVEWLLSLLFLVIVSSAPSDGQVRGTVYEYLTPEEARRIVLPNAVNFVSETIHLSGTEQRQIRSEIRRDMTDATATIDVGYDENGHFSGYAIIGEEIGKYRPITFMVGIDSSFAVSGVVILVYREDRGGKIRTPRFLRQYRDKTVSDAIRTHRDIVNISGATLSVRAMNKGVKKALSLVTTYYSNHPPAFSIDH